MPLTSCMARIITSLSSSAFILFNKSSDIDLQATIKYRYNNAYKRNFVQQHLLAHQRRGICVDNKGGYSAQNTTHQQRANSIEHWQAGN